MYCVYFFNRNGDYQTPMRQEDMQSSLEILLEFKSIVPQVLITRHDEIAVQADDGVITFPEMDPHTIASLEQAYPPKSADHRAFDLLDDYHHCAQRLTDAPAEEVAIAALQLRSLEIPLLAHAAREGLNLCDFGYQSAESILEERLSHATPQV